MPSRLAAPVLMVDAAKMHKVDTRNVENLFGMWTGETPLLPAADNPDFSLAVFSKCADSMEEGRRLENMSWRLWNRETFCCEAQPQLATTPAINVTNSRPKSRDIPELSVSVESVASEVDEQIESHAKPQTAPLNIRRPRLRRDGSMLSRSRGTEKHITSLGLEKMVLSIKEKRDLEPLSPSIADTLASVPSIEQRTTRELSPALAAPRQSSDSSASTAPISSPDSNQSATHTVGSDTSAELITSHSVIRGFSPGCSSSYRSHTNLAPTPVPGESAAHAKVDLSKKKGGVFFLGGSSGDDESSLDDHMSHRAPRSSLSDGLKRKQTTFKDEVEARTIDEGAIEDEEVFESDDDEDISESAIEDDDDDSSDWEDSATESGRSSVEEKPLFQRVDSRLTLTSRRSLITTALSQPQRAAALANAASKSTPAMHRSRTSSPNGPSVAASPDDESTLTMRGPDIPRSKPIIVTTSNTHPPALSPRSTRRNMLATELTESLRKHLVWERQQKSATANAVLKRRHTAQDVAHLQDFPGKKPAQSSKDGSKNNSWNHYFDHGLQEYHQTGW